MDWIGNFRNFGKKFADCDHDHARMPSPADQGPRELEKPISAQQRTLLLIQIVCLPEE